MTRRRQPRGGGGGAVRWSLIRSRRPGPGGPDRNHCWRGCVRCGAQPSGRQGRQAWQQAARV